MLCCACRMPPVWKWVDIIDVHISIIILLPPPLSNCFNFHSNVIMWFCKLNNISVTWHLLIIIVDCWLTTCSNGPVGKHRNNLMCVSNSVLIPSVVTLNPSFLPAITNAWYVHVCIELDRTSNNIHLVSIK